jgi:beta-lactamase class A
MKIRHLVVLFLLSPMIGLSQNAKDAFRLKIEQIARSSKGTVGVAIMGLEDRDTLNLNGRNHLPMQSVYKFPLAMAVLNQVDKGQLSLDQKIHLEKRDLLPHTWSPLRDKHPNADVDISIGEVLRYTVSFSDNNGCDILFRLLGGPKKVEEYIHGIGVKEIAIEATEEEMHKAWDVQFTNWCEPLAMVNLLNKLYQGKTLSKTSNDFLFKLMVETSTGPNRIKGLLPKETKVAHKTGSSGTNEKGITGALNDAGIVTLPNGKHFAIVVFVTNTTDSEKVNESIIAQTAKAAWDYFIQKNKS